LTCAPGHDPLRATVGLTARPCVNRPVVLVVEGTQHRVRDTVDEPAQVCPEFRTVRRQPSLPLGYRGLEICLEHFPFLAEPSNKPHQIDQAFDPHLEPL